MSEIKENVVCEINRKITIDANESVQQRFRFGEGMSEVIWLCGQDSHPSVQIGDRGKLIWSSDKGRGYWRFQKKF